MPATAHERAKRAGVPVLDAEDRLAGILSLGDLADASAPEATPTLEAVSPPAAPDR